MAYQHRLQAATSEGLKALAKLPDGNPNPVRHCFTLYDAAFIAYSTAALYWDKELVDQKSNPNEWLYQRVLNKRVRPYWSLASDRLDDATACTSSKSLK